jgi:hypothetical protein
MPARREFPAELMEEVIKGHFEEGWSVAKAARVLGCNWQTAGRVLKESDSGPIVTAHKHHSLEEVEAMHKDYLSTKSSKKTAAKYDISGDTLLNRFHDHDLEIIYESRLKVPKKEEDKIIKTYRRLKSLEKTRKATGRTFKTVFAVLKRRNEPTEKANDQWTSEDYEKFCGQRFGFLLVEEHDPGPKRISYACLCDPGLGGCGARIVVPKHDLLLGRTVSCGCRQRPGLYDVDTLNPETPIWIYLVELKAKDEESFYKIGITTQSPEKRFRQISNYEKNLVFSVLTKYEVAWAVEDSIKKDRGVFGAYYWPKKPFNSTSGTYGGRSECFKDTNDFLEHALDSLNEIQQE